MKGNTNIRNGFEYFPYSFDLVSNIGRPQDFPQTIYDPCNIEPIYRQGFNTTQIISDDNNNLSNEQGRNPIVSFYPNPAIDKLNVQIENVDLENQTDLQIKFYDAIGRDVSCQFILINSDFSISSVHSAIKLPNDLPNGIYKCTVIKKGIIISSFNFSN